MARLPIPGSDDGSWGQILNDFLGQSLNVDGTLKAAAVPVQSVNGKTGVVALTATDVGAPTNLAGLQDVNVGSATNTQVLAYDQPSGKWISSTVTSSVINDASGSTKGIVKLAGDLSGTADAPTVPGLAAKATDTAVVHLAGTETITGAKTFSSSPIVPAPSGTTAAVNRSYVDTAVAGADVSGAAATAQTNAATYTDTQIATSPAFVMYNTGGSVYPSRSTATSSSTRVVIWIGPVAPSVGGSGAVDGLDVWWRTP